MFRLLIILTALFCTGCGATVYRQDGVQVSPPHSNRPAGEPKPLMSGWILNASQHVMEVDYNWLGYQLVAPGDSIQVSSTTKEKLEINFRAQIPVKFDLDHRRIQVEKTAYYDWSQTMVIDDLFWLGMELQRGHIFLTHPSPAKWVRDDRGNNYGPLEPGGEAVGYLAPGWVTVWWEIDDPSYSGRLPRVRSERFYVDEVHNDVPYKDGVTDWTFEIHAK